MVTQYSDLTSDTARIAFIKDKLMTNEQWMLKGLYTIYQYQTEEEQNTETTRFHNGVGFSGVDGEILTSFAKQLIRKGYEDHLRNKLGVRISQYFSPKQEAILRKKIGKYARQLVRVTKGVN